MSRFNADGGQARAREAIVKPLRQRPGFETNSLEGAVDTSQHIADVDRVRNRLCLKDHSALGIDNADAGHLQ